MVKHSQVTAKHGWNLDATGDHATLNATDQAPQRAIDSSLIGRFGNIDPALGGRTTRLGFTSNAHLGDTKINLDGFYYRFRLTSNVTYFLNDPVNGDEFKQRDQRGPFGGSICHSIPTTIGGIPVAVAIGGEGR